MPRRPDLKAGDVLSFRIPENISLEDLTHLKRIAKRPTTGKAGAINAFFFSKVTEDRIQQSRHISIDLPELSEEQLTLLESPVLKKALIVYAYQILGLRVPNVENTPMALNDDESALTENEVNTPFDRGQVQHEKQTNLVDGPDPRALDLIRKLQG